MLRRLSVRGKILAALAVPVLVLVFAASVFSLQAIRDAQVASQAAGLIQSLPAGQAALTAIQAERASGVRVLDKIPGAMDEYAAAQLDTEAALAALREQYTTLDFSRLDRKVTVATEDALMNNITTLAIVRDNVARGARTAELASADYSTAISRYLAIPAALAATLPDRDLATKLDTFIELNYLVTNLTLEAPLVQHTLDEVVAGADTSVGERSLSAIFGETNASRNAATQSVRSLDVEDLKIPQTSSAYDSIRRLIGAGQSSSMNSGLAYNWPALSAHEVEAIDPIRAAALDLTTDSAESATSNARETAIYTVLATMVALLASVAIAVGISRRITIPLRHLTDAAAEVREQLPKLVEQVSVPGQGPEITLSTIKVESADEVGQLAEAFNAVNTTTVEVAREQAALRGSIAEMFVNVARRDHVLLNRQLAFLDELERSEEDANTLANLFRLDHLATRMRRNSESLLVLAGIDSGRRVRQPMPVSDVVRTASSEIELYDRIRLNLEADPFMLGHNALNAAHLLAELLENATTFSEPNSPVEVTTNRSSRYVTVEVRDHGLGMTDEDITEANWKVASRSATDVVGVQRLGLFVVGRLADRLGAHVVFSRAADGSAGTSVVVSFPLSLFADEADVPLAVPSDPLTAENRQATDEWIAPEADAQPVDIAALTDGATSIGMPRRRTALATGTVEQVPDPSAAPAEMVLPPLESANPSVSLASPDDLNWTPDQTLAETLPAGLPSRSRGAATTAPAANLLEPVNDEPILDSERRGAIFSNFRTRASAEAASSLEASGSAAIPIVPTPSDVPDNKAAPLVVPGLVPDDELPWQPPAVELTQDLAPDPSADQAYGFQPVAEYQPLPDREPFVDHQPVEPFEAPADADSWAQPAEHLDTRSELPEAYVDYEPASHGAHFAPMLPSAQTYEGVSFEAEQEFVPVQAFQPLSPRDLPQRDELTGTDTAWAPIALEPDEAPAQRAEELGDAATSAEDLPQRLDEAQRTAEEADAPSGLAGPAPDRTSAFASTPASFEPTMPTFADVVSDAPTRRSSRAAATPAKRGVFGRLRRKDRNAAAPERGDGVVAPISFPTFSPTFSPTDAPAATAPAAFMPSVGAYPPAVDRPVTDLPVAGADAPRQAFAPAEPAGPPASAPAAWLPATSVSSSDDDGGLGGLGGWRPPAPVEPMTSQPVPLSDLPLSGLDGADRWAPPSDIDGDISSMLAMRSNIQEQALAELSQLSSYRPAAVATTQGGGLTRRTRGEVAASTDDLASQKISRDAAELRSRLSAFQSATSRGRQAPETSPADASADGHAASATFADNVPDSAPQPR